MKLLHNRKLERQGFTLIELLLVIAILAVLSTLAVGIMASAQEDARLSASRARVAIISKLLEIELEEYEVRRPPLSIGVINGIVASATAGSPSYLSRNVTVTDGTDEIGNSRLLHARNLRRMLIADMIRAEMPSGRERPVELDVFPSGQLQNYLDNRLMSPGATLLLRLNRSSNVRRWSSFAGVDEAAYAALSPDEQDEQRSIDGGELLYEILSRIERDGTRAIDSLGTAAFGDNDGDGVLEIVDGWGDPINFEFHQPNIVPVEELVINAPTSPDIHGDDAPYSGNWVQRDAAEFTDFGLVRPCLSVQIRPFVTSANLTEIDGTPTDFE